MLKIEIIDCIENNYQLILKICMISKKSPGTIRRWLKNNSPELTQFYILLLLSKEFNKPMHELLEPIEFPIL